MILLILSQTSTVQPLKFGNAQVISSHTLLGMWLIIHAGIKLTYCSQMSPIGWGLLKTCFIISPFSTEGFNFEIASKDIILITLNFDRCHRSWATEIHVKYVNSVEPRPESFDPTFVAGIDLPRQGVVGYFNLVDTGVRDKHRVSEIDSSQPRHETQRCRKSTNVQLCLIFLYISICFESM